jgi:hypothetical protein
MRLLLPIKIPLATEEVHISQVTEEVNLLRELYCEIFYKCRLISMG